MGLFCMEAGLFHFLRFLVSAYKAYIVTGSKLPHGSHADSKGFCLQKILNRLMPFCEGKHHLVHFVMAAPGCIHRIRRPVLVIGSNDKDWLRKRNRVNGKFFSHIYPS